MDHIGIDLGAYSTLVCRSLDRGTMLEDEMNKRSIRTVVDLLHPRMFGNRIRVDNRRSIQARRREFSLLKNEEDDYKILFMFLSYLKRLGGLKCVSFAVPYWYTEVHKRKLLALSERLDISVKRIVYDISAISLCLVKHENIPQSFCILDFGYSKTTAGFFSFKDRVLRLERILGVGVGARDMDNKLVEYFIDKNGVKGNCYTKEIIMSKIDYLKTVLNATESVSIHADDDFILEVSKEEYEKIVSEELAQLRDFIDRCAAECKEQGRIIEVHGGNSNNYAIRALLPKESCRSLNPTESVAIGSSLISLVDRSKVTFRDVSSTYFVKLKGSDVKPSLLFSSSEVPCGNIKVTYRKRENFSVEVLENDTLIGEVNVSVSAEEPVPVTITFCINKRGVLEVGDFVDGEALNEASDSRRATIEPKMVGGFSEDDLSTIVEEEEKFRTEEAEMEKIRERRTNFETLLTGLNSNLQRFNGRFENHRGLIDTITDELLCHPPSRSFKEEEDVCSCFLERLRPLTEELCEFDQEVKQEIQDIKSRIDDITKRYSKMYTPGLYQLRGERFMIEKWESNFKLSVETIMDYDMQTVNDFRKKVDALIERAENEAAEKIRADEEAERVRAKSNLGRREKEHVGSEEGEQEDTGGMKQDGSGTKGGKEEPENPKNGRGEKVEDQESAKDDGV